jgi:ribose transport system ATP-binding protein
MGSASLALSGISKRYPGVQALYRVDFECRPGEIHAVLGENGSGKSTLLGIAGGATAADEGDIRIMGERLGDADPLLARRLGLATVYQDDSLVRELSVADNLILGAVDAATTIANKRAWAQHQLAPYDLDISPDMLVGGLNPAQRQFLEIVKALSARPKVPSSMSATACRKSSRSPIASRSCATARGVGPMRSTTGSRRMI